MIKPFRGLRPSCCSLSLASPGQNLPYFYKRLALSQRVLVEIAVPTKAGTCSVPHMDQQIAARVAPPYYYEAEENGLWPPGSCY
jgi:hypothetical protein